jgi:hypothetical protein
MKRLPRHLPGLAGPGREPDKGRDLSTVERTECRQFGNQGPGDRLSYAGHGSEEILFLDRAAAGQRRQARPMRPLPKEGSTFLGRL